MKKAATILALVLALSGCVASRHDQISPGSHARQIGVANTYMFLRYSGKVVEVGLTVKVDENGNTILVAEEGSPKEIAVYLSEAARRELVANMVKARECCAAASIESIEPFEFAGNNSDNRNSSVLGRISLGYAWHESGNDWICNMELSGYDIRTAAAPHFGTPSGRKDVRLVLTPASVEKLLTLIASAPDLTSISFDKTDRLALQVDLQTVFNGVS
jgi:hypothetical protein